MEELVEYLARGLVDKPDDVRVVRAERDGASSSSSTSPPRTSARSSGARDASPARFGRSCARAAALERTRACSRSLAELIPVGRVGRPHGLDGSFVVEQASEDPERFEPVLSVSVDGAGGHRGRVQARRQPARRPARPRGRSAEPFSRFRAPSWPRSGEGELLRVRARRPRGRGGRGGALGRVQDVTSGVANDVLELDTGTRAAAGRGLRPFGRSRAGA